MANDKKDSSLKGSDLQSVITAYNLYKGWNYMSPAQKSMAIASLGMQGYRFSTGENLATYPLVKNAQGATELSLGQAFDLFSRGYNAYALAKNWNQIGNIQKVIGGAKFATDLAKTAKSFNLFGYGSTNSAVKGLNASALSQSWSSASNYGIGAVTAPAGTTIPTGYTAVASGGEGIIAVPTGTLPSATGAIEATAMSGAGGGGAGGAATTATQSNLPSLGNVAGAVSFAAGAYQLYKGWGEGGAPGRVNGAIGGTMMAAGLYGMSVTNPYVLAATVALSVLGGSIKTGKSGDQKARDGVLSHLVDRGVVGKDYTMQLPDGTVMDLGIDGHGNLHTVKNPDLVKDKSRAGENKLSWWDTDYTNDLDFWSGTAGTTLMRLMAGGKNKASDQVGGKIGNGAIAGIGFGQEFTPDNFNRWRDNMRSVYSQFGVKSKADGFQLVNQMFAENRIDESDAVSMHQVLNILYDDNGYNTAQALSAGRHRGMEVAEQDKDEEYSETVSISGPAPTSTYSAGSPEGEIFTGGNQVQLRPGANTFANPPAIVTGVPRTPQGAFNAANASSIKDSGFQMSKEQADQMLGEIQQPNRQGWSPATRSKEELQAQNKMKFQSPQMSA